MEIKKDDHEMLEELTYPAFLVQNKVIVYANQAARNRQVNIGKSIEDLISVGKQEYLAFEGGRLFLTLSVGNSVHKASVVKLEQSDLFLLDSDYEAPELRAFALAAQCLREPLTAALDNASTLLTEKNQKASQEIKQIARSLYQFHRALNNMSDVSSYEQLRMSVTENRNIVEILTEILQQATAIASAANRTLEHTLPQKAIYCMIDAEKVERAVLNLISNAIKFSPKGSSISVKFYQSDARLFFSVENPINDKSISRDVNPFTRYLREPGLDSKTGNFVNSPVLLPYDYAGGFSHLLTELSDILPLEYLE